MSVTIREHVSLASYTTLKTGGVALYVIAVTTEDDVKTAVTFAKTRGLPFFVLGSGSNILVSDTGYDGVVVKLNIPGRAYRDTCEVGYIEATFGAGEILDDVIQETVAKGYWGLENLSHIPGTIGATPIQNVGAYGVEVSDLITGVTVYDTQTQSVTSLSTTQCEFSYRDSRFKQNSGRYIVLRVTFRLSVAPVPRLQYADLALRLSTGEITLSRVRETIIAIRSSKFPDWKVVGTAGSFFKNPIISEAETETLLAIYPEVPVYPAAPGYRKVSLGYILDKVCGLKGFRIGNIRLYEAQALVLVAEAGATTAAIDAFVEVVTNIVQRKTNIVIEREVTKIS